MKHIKAPISKLINVTIRTLYCTKITPSGSFTNVIQPCSLLCRVRKKDTGCIIQRLVARLSTLSTHVAHCVGSKRRTQIAQYLLTTSETSYTNVFDQESWVLIIHTLDGVLCRASFYSDTMLEDVISLVQSQYRAPPMRTVHLHARDNIIHFRRWGPMYLFRSIGFVSAMKQTFGGLHQRVHAWLDATILDRYFIENWAEVHMLLGWCRYWELCPIAGEIVGILYDYRGSI